MRAFKIDYISQNIKKASRNPLVRNMMIVGTVTMIIKAVAFYKETMIAGAFGLSEILDTFLIAMLVPSFIQSIFINSLKNIFIPNYISDMKSGGPKSSFQSVIFLIAFGICAISVLIAFLSTDVFIHLIYPGHTPEFYQLIKDQLFYVLPCLFLWGLSSVLHGLLEIENRFLIATIPDFFSILTMILFLIFLRDELGHMVLALGTLAGSTLSFSILLFFTIKYKDLSLSRPVLNNNVKLMIRQLPAKVSASFLSAINNYVDQFFAAQLIAGSITAISYGIRIPYFGIAIVTMALGSVLLPHFSRMVNEDVKSAYKHLFKTLKVVFISSSIFVIIAIFMSDWLIEVLFERGKFTHDDTLKVSLIQKIIFVHVPFYLCTLIIVKFLTSINKNSFMAWISLANLIINLVLNIIFVKFYGVYGLAVSTSLVLIISSCFYFWYTNNQYKKLKG